MKRIVFLALGAAAVIAVAFVTLAAFTQVERYKIPSGSGSMKPTLLPGSIVNVEKYPAGAQPARGDLIAFRVPSEPKSVFLERVIGLEDDKMQVVNGALQINGAAVKREEVADFADAEDGKPQAVKQWRETLPGGASYNVIKLVPHGPFDNTALVTVPAGHLFVLGDNRDDVRDSRDPSVGMIPLENVVGRVVK